MAAPESCGKCPQLSKNRLQVVNGDGPREPGGIMFIGQNPGRHEDMKGRPFVGDAGFILDRCLNNIGWKRKHVRVENLVRCLTPQNREPDPAEIANCLPYLLEEIAQQKPKVIIPLGGPAWKSLSDSKVGIMKARCQEYWSEQLQAKLVPTLHPAYAVRNWPYIPVIEHDLRFARAVYEDNVQLPLSSKVYVCKTVRQVNQLAEYITNDSSITSLTFDIESTGLNPRKSQIMCISFCAIPGYSYVVPILQHDPKNPDVPMTYWSESDYELVHFELSRILQSDIPKRAQNGYFDISMVQHKLDMTTLNYKFDTMLAHHLIDENMPHNLEWIMTFYTDMPVHKGMVDFKKHPAQWYENDVLWEYNGKDSDSEMRASITLKEALDRQGEGVNWVFENIAMPLAPILKRFEDRGIAIDMDLMKDLSKSHKVAHATLEAQLLQQAGELNWKGSKFNYRSFPQLTHKLYEELKFPVVHRTAKKNPSTDADTIIELLSRFPNHPVLVSLLACRKHDKIITTYLDGRDGESGLLKNIEFDEATQIHRFYPGVLETGTVSGRLSSSPNYHNVPSKKDEFKIGDTIILPASDENLRHMFIATPAYGNHPGYLNCGADASNIEMRVGAVLSREPALLEGFCSGRDFDVHYMVAMKLTGKPRAEISKALRRIYKTINFGVFYGMGPETMAVEMSSADNPTTADQAKGYIAEYFAQFPVLAKWIQHQHKLVKDVGFVENLFGRRRRLQGIHSKEDYFGDIRQLETEGEVYAEMDRQSVNTPIQGTAADIIHLSAIRLDNRIREMGLDAHLTLHVHDHLNYEVRVDQVKDFMSMFMEEFEKKPHPKFDVPLFCDPYISNCWEGENIIKELCPDIVAKIESEGGKV
jgi:DNA polymerase-1